MSVLLPLSIPLSQQVLCVRACVRVCVSVSVRARVFAQDAHDQAGKQISERALSPTHGKKEMQTQNTCTRSMLSRTNRGDKSFFHSLHLAYSFQRSIEHLPLCANLLMRSSSVCICACECCAHWFPDDPVFRHTKKHAHVCI